MSERVFGLNGKVALVRGSNIGIGPIFCHVHHDVLTCRT